MNRPFATKLASMTFLALGLALLSAPVACGGDEDEAKTPEAGCKSLCTDSGFASSRVDVQPNEVNCFCTGGGSSTVAAAACSKMCADIKRGNGQPFSGTGGPLDACQCQ